MYRATGEWAGINVGQRQKGADNAPAQLDMIDIAIDIIDGPAQSQNLTATAASLAPTENDQIDHFGTLSHLLSLAGLQFAFFHCL